MNMHLPTWAIVTSSIVGYFLIGVIFAMLAAYRAGRNHEITFDGFDGGAWTLAWPIMCAIHGLHFLAEKYDAFLAKIQQYGHESTLPPKNESAGRLVIGDGTSTRDMLYRAGVAIHIEKHHPQVFMEECPEITCQKISKVIQSGECR